MQIHVQFEGPYSWFGEGDVPSVHESSASREPGIYLWTAGTPDGELVWYIGETGKTIGHRLKQHLRLQRRGEYRILEPTLFVRGEKQYLWTRQPGENEKQAVDRFRREPSELQEMLAEFVGAMHFMIAPLDVDQRTRRRIEAAIADHLYRQPGTIGAFQERDIRYEPRQPAEDPFLVSLGSKVPICGLPAEVLA